MIFFTKIKKLALGTALVQSFRKMEMEKYSMSRVDQDKTIKLIILAKTKSYFNQCAGK